MENHHKKSPISKSIGNLISGNTKNGTKVTILTWTTREKVIFKPANPKYTSKGELHSENQEEEHKGRS